MKFNLAILLFLMVSFSSLGQTATPAWTARLADKALLMDIEHIGDDKLIAVGQFGHILLSNNGDDWRQVASPINSTLNSVFFVDQRHGWIVGHDASILATTDGGESWQLQQYLPKLEKPLFDIAFQDQNHGIAVGAYGHLFRTKDGGKNWQYEFHQELLPVEDIEYLEEIKLEDEEAYLDERSSILPHFNRLEVDGRTLYLTGELGLIAKSNDFGKTWLRFDEIYQGSFFDIARTQRGNLIVAGLRGNIFRSLQNGAPWQPTDSGTTALLNSIVLADEHTFYLVGNSGVVLETDDDGQTFRQHIQPDGKAIIAAVWFKGKLIAATEVGIKEIQLIK